MSTIDRPAVNGELGVDAAKDSISVEDYHRVRNHLEDKYTKVRVPAGKFAETILK